MSSNPTPATDQPLMPDSLRPGGRFDTWRPARPRYVVVDVDGTLVGEGTTATPRVRDAVAGASAAGLAIGFATGRLPAGLTDLRAQLALSGPHLVHNGAEVLADGQRVAAWPLSPAEVKSVLEVLGRLDVYAEFYVGDGFLVTDYWEPARPHWELITGGPDGLITAADLDVVEVVRVCPVLVGDEGLERLIGELRALGLAVTPSSSPIIPGMHFVNTTDAAADKGQALAVAARHLGCSLAEVVAVGDGANDVAMLDVAGTAIAMGQAPREVLAAAHLVAPEVAADGVAHALESVTAWLAEPQRG